MNCYSAKPWIYRSRSNTFFIIITNDTDLRTHDSLYTILGKSGIRPLNNDIVLIFTVVDNSSMQVNLVRNAAVKIFSIHLDQAAVVCNLKFLVQFGLVLLISVLEITHQLNLQPKSMS